MTTPARTRSAVRFGRTGTVVGAAFLLTLLSFWPTIATLPATWMQFGQSHGWLIAALVPWLVWRDRDRFLQSGGSEPLLLLPLAALSLVWLLAAVTQLRLVHQTMLVLLLTCWGLAVFGRRSATQVLGFGALLLLALPLWGIVVPVLRPLTTLASGSLARLVGMEAVIEGNMIRIPVGRFLVEDGCAGLNTFMSALVVGALYAHLFVRGRPRQLAVVALSMGIAIVGNWVRVFILIAVGHFTEMQSPMMDGHLWLGWAIFVIGLVPFFALADGWSSGSRAAASTGDESRTEPARRQDRIAASNDGRLGLGLARAAAVATAVALLGPILYHSVTALPGRSAEGSDLGAIARGVEWRTISVQRPFDWRPEFLNATRHETAVLTDGTGRVVVDRFVYEDQTQGAELIGYPNRIAPDSLILSQRVLGPINPEGRRWAREAIVWTPEAPILTWYWFRVGGMETVSAAHAKALEIPAFFTRRRSAELLAFSTRCEPESCAKAFRTLAELMGADVSAERTAGAQQPT